MSNTLKEARLIASGETVRVYRMKAGGWCNYDKPLITYTESDLNIIKNLE